MNKITIYIAYHYYIYSTLCCSGERTKQYSTHIIYLRPLKIDLKKDMTHKTDLITEVSYQIICTIISNLQDLTKSRKVSAKKKKKDGHDEGLQEKELDEQLRQPGLQEYRAKRSPAVKGFLAIQGGTPISNKLPSLVQNRFLSFHVHRLAQKMTKKLSREPLRNEFF